MRHRQRAEECVPLAQPAKPHQRAILLDIATQWSTLAAHDAETQALLVAIKKMDGRGQSPSQSE